MSDVARNRQVEKMVNALQKQLDEDFTPAWGLQAKLVFNEEPLLSMKIFIKDKASEEDKSYLGYHFRDGLPITYVFAKDDIDSKGEFSTTLSHELLEMLADPGVNLYALGFYRDKADKRRQAFVSYEVCDPVEASSYRIDGVPVSNFVLPEWYEPEHEDGSMQMDFLGRVHSPFKLAPGGYMDAYWNGKIKTIWGPEAARKRRRHRKDRRSGYNDGDLRLAGMRAKR